MATAISANRLELLQIADAVARDKSIDKQVVLTAMEEAIQRAAKAHYGTENDIKVDIDPKTGETHVSRHLHVIEQVENDKIGMNSTLQCHLCCAKLPGFTRARRNIVERQ